MSKKISNKTIVNNITMSDVTIGKKKYPIRELLVHGKDFLSYIKVAGQSLEDRLITPDGDYTNERAQAVDEDIYCYVEDKLLHLSDDQLEKLILANFC